MTTKGDDVRRAADLVKFVERWRQDGFADVDDRPHATYWPAVAAEEAAMEWDRLRRWVGRLRVRFPVLARLPDCWWRHNEIVEVLSALRDYERDSFDASSPATAAVEWQRALRDMEPRIDVWIKRLKCEVAGHVHDVVQPSDEAPPGWSQFVHQDAQRRQRDQKGGDDVPAG